MKARELGPYTGSGKGEVEMSRDFAIRRLRVHRFLAAGAAITLVLLSAMATVSAAELFGSVSAGGKGRAGVDVVLLSGERPVATVRTSRQGTYRFRNIAPGNYHVRVADQVKTVYVGPGVNRLNIAK